MDEMSKQYRAPSLGEQEQLLEVRRVLEEALMSHCKDSNIKADILFTALLSYVADMAHTLGMSNESIMNYLSIARSEKIPFKPKDTKESN